VRISRSDCLLLVVDVQDRLIDTMAEHRAIVENVKALLRAAQVLGLPVLATEQEKLGEIVLELQGLLGGSPKFRKLSFSCCGDFAFLKKLRQLRRKIVIVCGIETHVCVLQTVLDLLKLHYRVMVVKDATSSHALIDRDTAMERMQNTGAIITTTEALIYELTEKAGTEEFRRILEIVKERRSTHPPKYKI
jgi:nicotinamidase-related amidase